MAISQVKTRLEIVDDRQSSRISLNVDDDADVEVPHNVEILTFSTRHSRTDLYLSTTRQVSKLIK